MSSEDSDHPTQPVQFEGAEPTESAPTFQLPDFAEAESGWTAAERLRACAEFYTHVTETPEQMRLREELVAIPIGEDYVPALTAYMDSLHSVHVDIVPGGKESSQVDIIEHARRNTGVQLLIAAANVELRRFNTALGDLEDCHTSLNGLDRSYPQAGFGNLRDVVEALARYV
jgi:hypothetical protein